MVGFDPYHQLANPHWNYARTTNSTLATAIDAEVQGTTVNAATIASGYAVMCSISPRFPYSFAIDDKWHGYSEKAYDGVRA